MGKRNHTAGYVLAAFGAGILLAEICPAKLILVLAAVALVLAGIACNRN